MANGKIRFGKQAGGQLALVIPDGVTNTEVIVPESGVLATEDYVDNNSDIGAITSYSQISGTNTIEGVELTNNIHDIFGDGRAVATYQLNENANDLGGTYNGTATNVTYEEGKFGQAAKFNGSSSYVNGFNFNNMNTTTISTWIKPSNLGSLHYIYGQSNSGGQDVSLGVSLAVKNATTVIIYHNNKTYKEFSYTFTPGTYYHIVHKIEGTVVTVYINNILIGSHNFGVNRLAFNSSTFAFGRWGEYSAHYFNGLINQVRIFNRALTETEINTLYSESRVSANAELTINQGTFIYPKGLASKGYAKSSDTFTGTVLTSGVSDGWKYVAKDESDNFSFYSTKPTLGKTTAELYLKDGKLYKSSDDTEITPISFLSNKVRFASGGPVELAPSGIAKIVTDSFETAGFDLGQTWQDVTASRSAGVTYTNNTGKAIEVLINIIGNNTTLTIDTLTTNPIASNPDYTTITATIPVGSTYKISSGIQKWFELR